MNQHIQEEELFKKILPLNKARSREILASKIELSEFCGKKRIPTPAFFVRDNGTDLEVAICGVKFPLFVKEDYGWGVVEFFSARIVWPC